MYTNCNEINGLAIEGDSVWWATTGGIVRWNRQDGTYEQYTALDYQTTFEFNTVATDTEGMKWFGGDMRGHIADNDLRKIVSFDGTTWRLHDISSGIINSIALDQNGVKWFASDGGSDGGVVRLDGTDWTTFTTDNSGLPDNQIRTVLAEENGSLLISAGDSWGRGTPKYGLIRFDGDTWTTVKLPGIQGNDIYAIAVDHDNVKWISTGSDWGLSRFDGSTWTTYTEEDGLCWDVINAIAVDDSNVKWFGSLYSITVSTFDGSVWSGFDPGVKVGGYNSLAIDRDRVKWLGTKYQGLLSFDGHPVRPASVDASAAAPSAIEIAGIYPNPFNARTTIEFTLHAPGFVRLDVYNLLGQKVKKLVCESVPVGHHRIVWDGRDHNGNDVSSGIYFFRLQAGNGIDREEALLLR